MGSTRSDGPPPQHYPLEEREESHQAARAAGAALGDMVTVTVEWAVESLGTTHHQRRSSSAELARLTALQRKLAVAHTTIAEWQSEMALGDDAVCLLTPGKRVSPAVTASIRAAAAAAGELATALGAQSQLVTQVAMDIQEVERPAGWIAGKIRRLRPLVRHHLRALEYRINTEQLRQDVEASIAEAEREGGRAIPRVLRALINYHNRKRRRASIDVDALASVASFCERAWYRAIDDEDMEMRCRERRWAV